MNAYGERIEFEFTITDGAQAGAMVSRSTTPQLSKLSKLAEVIEGMAGRKLTEAELANGFDLESLIDVTCNILVLQSTSKVGAVYSSVERVFQA